ncbi:MAG TPA: PAS domain-containing protein [Spirochaetota bacterium]|nr:PAS domain-containing protein [Spirochaetota bacterium]
MILVKRVVLYVAFFIMAIMMIVPGAVYYIRLEGIDALGNDLIRYNAENLVYLGIVGVVVLLVLFLLIHRGGVRVLKAIDKVSELSGYGRYYSGEYMRKLGRLGEKINRLFGELNSLNEMKSLKISAVSNLVSFFLENASLHCFIADIQGTIGSVSKRFAEKLKTDGQGVIGRSLTDMIKEFDFAEIKAELERNRSAVSKKGLMLVTGDTTLQGQFTFYPVFNAKNELSNIVGVSEKETLIEGITKKADQIRVAQKRITGIFRKRPEEKDAD